MKLVNYSSLYSFSSSGGSGASKSALNFLHLCSVCNTLPFPRKNLVSTSFWFLPLKILTLSPLIRHDSLVSLYTLLTSYPFHYVNLCSFLHFNYTLQLVQLVRLILSAIIHKQVLFPRPICPFFFYSPTPSFPYPFIYLHYGPIKF